MPKQELSLIDYFGPVAALVIFASAMLVLSFFIVIIGVFDWKVETKNFRLISTI